MAHVAQWKMERVQELTEAITSSPVVGIVNVHGIPGKQLQQMRARLRGSVGVLVTKRTFINLAIENASGSRPGIEGLREANEGQVALVYTNENPFRLYKMMEMTKIMAPARGGEEAPEDIVIKAGDTSFKPGPIVREFQKVGIPAAIEQGKVVIKRDAVLVKAGDVIPKDLATVLPRLDILPIEIGLDLQAAYEDGVVYTPDVLDVDVGALMGQIGSGAAAAFNLAVNARIFNDATIRPLLAKGKVLAFSLAVEMGIMTPDTAVPILSRAQARAMALASMIPEALPDELRERLAGVAAAATAPAEEEEAPAKADEKKDEDKEEEKVSEEDAAAGLSALFG